MGAPARATAAEDPYEINAVVSLTGTAAFLGQEEIAAVYAARTSR